MFLFIKTKKIPLDIKKIIQIFIFKFILKEKKHYLSYAQWNHSTNKIIIIIILNFLFLSFEIRIRKCNQNYQMMIMRQQHVGPARKMEFEKQRLDNTIEHLKSSGNSEQKHSCIEIFSLKKKN